MFIVRLHVLIDQDSVVEVVLKGSTSGPIGRYLTTNTRIVFAAVLNNVPETKKLKKA